MELAIPMVLLGGMYVLSNNDEKKEESKQGVVGYNSSELTKEGFAVNNREIPKRKQKEMPNMRTRVKNFPTTGKSELVKNPSYYANPNASVDKYYSSSSYEKNHGSSVDTSFKSLTGETVSSNDLEHNNMVPFFGSSIKQNTRDLNNNESRLDNMVGSGSQQIRKQEIAPMFKPEENMQWAFGTPNVSDFVQSRMNPSMSMNNVKPFSEIRVAPGLSERGGTLGSGGFNAGMEARERWLPKTVDELRVLTDPKKTYAGVVLGGKADVTNRGIIGKVEQHKPDTYYVNGPERYLTTTGLEKAPTARAIELLKCENRTSTTREYFGTTGDAQVEATYVDGVYQQPKRAQLAADIKHMSNAHANGAYEATTGDHGILGYKDSVKGNNRMLTEGQSQFGAVSSFAKAVVAPLLDLLRPSRKENAVGNLRPSGNAGSAAVSAGVVYNPSERARTTIREMTENRPDHMFVSNQSEYQRSGVTSNPHQAVSQERDSTSIYYNGIGGNTALTSNAPTYNAAYNANLIDKAPISVGRTPMGSNAKMFNGGSYTNIKVDKQDCDRLNNRMFVPQQMVKSIASKQQIGLPTTRTEYGEGIQCQRTQPDLLNAFRSNPLTHSLQSYA